MTIIHRQPIQWLTYALQWNALFFSVQYNQMFAKISMKVNMAFRENPAVLSKWQHEFMDYKQQIDDQLDNYLPRFESEVIFLTTMESPYIKEFQQEIMKLQPIQIAEKHDDQPVLHVNSLVDEIKDEVKKGNRVAFKLMSELQEKIDELSAEGAEAQKQAIQAAIEEYEEKAEGFIHLSIQALDSLELISQSAMKAGFHEWSEEIKKIIDDFLGILDSYGIEEIHALGEMIDGETMISVGTVPQDRAPQYEKFQVCEVWERGFRLKENGKIIREAKVKTVY